MGDATPQTNAADMGAFVHLHLHSEFSLLDGGNQVDKLVARIAELGMKAVAVTDHGNIFGAVSLYETCKAKGIKPILGVEAYVTPPGKPRTDRTYTGGGEGGFHLVLLAMDNIGWQNLLVLCSEAYRTGFYYKPRIDRELLAKHAQGLIAINGHLGSEIGDHLLDFARSQDPKHWEMAVESARWHKQAFADPADAPGPIPRAYIELQHHVPEQNAINPLLIKLARQEGMPLICDNDSHFLRAEDHDAHDTLICISTGKNKSDPNRMRYSTDLYVKSAEQMHELFAGDSYNNEQFGDAGKEALANTIKVAAACNVELPLGKNNSPAVRIDLPEASTLPSSDDPKYAGDVTAWYKDYCAAFELKPFTSTPTAEELAKSKVDCDTALRMLAEGGFKWRYGIWPKDVNALGGPDVPAGPRDFWSIERKRVLCPSGFVGRDPYPPGVLGAADDVLKTQRYLPHIAMPGATYFVTWRTWKRTLDDRSRDLVLSALRHFDPDRCKVFAACVMPDHVHWIVKPNEGVSLDDLVRSVKTYSSREVNALVAATGSVWEDERFDHVVRNSGDLTRFLWYIADNPVEAGLAKAGSDYPWVYLHPDVLASGAEGSVGDRRTTQTSAQDGSIHADPQLPDKVARLERELKILADKNISAYFLIVWDFVNWGRQRGIPANARGSGVGTMVGYVLGLSNACPVKYGLLFERFTDPDRSEYPDIDIDLCQDGRASVIEYVRQKYGHVAQIITFGTLKARAAIRDVGRVLGMPIPDVDRVAKLIPETLNIEIADALKEEPDLQKLYDTDPQVRQLLDNAIQLEGHTRHAGVHAAGVIVATRPLQEIVPLYKAPGGAENEIITQWDGPTCEKMGLLKMDFLGLRTLSIIERARTLIKETLREEEIWHAVGREPGNGPHPLDLDRLSSDDPKVFTLFQRGDTTGVFQFESGGMRRLLVEMKPDRLEDLIAANALFRPGPMDLIPDYNRRKHGADEVPRVHDIVDRYTNETYGVMVYQEQVMQIVHGLGGIKLRDAYTLIKNISKKKHDKIEKERPKFVDGAQKQGLSKEKAEELFELILKFAGYGFNKSHSTGYAIVAYQTAYLKTYFPIHYMAAFLTFESQANKVSDWITYLEDCKRTLAIDPSSGATTRMGVVVRAPDINLSRADFAVVRDDVGGAAAPKGLDGKPLIAAHNGHVRFGLRALKGVGDKAIDTIITERTKSGPFTSLFDFCERVPPGTVSKSVLEALIKSGSFDSVHGRNARAAMVATIEQALSAGAKMAQDKAAGQGGLFMGGGLGAGVNAASASKPQAASPLAKTDAWSANETLRQEKETLGFYLSSHPLEEHKGWTAAFTTGTVSSVKDQAQDARVVLAAMVQSSRQIVVKNGRSAGQKMAILTVEDATGACDCVMFTDCFQKYGHLAEAEKVIFVLGTIDLKRGDPQVIIDRIAPIDGVPLEPGRVRLFLDEQRLNGDAPAKLERVAMLLQQHASEAPQKLQRGESGDPRFPVELVIGTSDQVAIMACDAKIRLTPSPDLFGALVGQLGEGMIRVTGIAVEKVEKKVWQKRRPSGDDDV